MTLKNLLEASRIYDYKYADDLDSDGMQNDRLRNGSIFADLSAPPVVSANSIRRDIITRLVNGQPISTENLSSWAKVMLTTWTYEANRLTELGITPEKAD